MSYWDTRLWGVLRQSWDTPWNDGVTVSYWDTLTQGCEEYSGMIPELNGVFKSWDNPWTNAVNMLYGDTVTVCYQAVHQVLCYAWDKQGNLGYQSGYKT